jgi:hypothetical protein
MEITAVQKVVSQKAQRSKQFYAENTRNGGELFA